ncbi:MAG TPA: hypothetical protein VFR81_09370 [Longimicrobium sp.]|nr:hypothetical protein [Longimicrobium sp.]
MQVKRVAAVTAALAVAGAMVGAVCGAVLMLAFVLVEGTGGDPIGEFLAIFAWGAMVGAALGAVLGPLSAWLLMRHVPIGLAIGGTALGTLVGAVIGLFVNRLGGALAFGLGGFAVAAIALWLMTPRGSRVAAPPSA